MEVKAKLIKLLKQAYAVEEEFINQLSDEERLAQGSPEHWSAKDLVAHITAWKQILIERLQNRERDPAAGEGHDARNRQIFDTYREMAWPEVQARAEQVFQNLLEIVGQFSESELTDPAYFPWSNNRPAWRLASTPGFNHPNTHIAEFYHQRGETQRAMLLQESTAEGLKWLCEEPAWCGIAVYNLACFYSTTGQTDRALRRLREALTLNPALREWSKQDPDLKPLHIEPAYRSLYE